MILYMRYGRPVPPVRIKPAVAPRRLHRAVRAVGEQSIKIRRVSRLAKRYPADTIQPDVTPVVIAVPVNHNARVQHTAAAVFRTVVRRKHPDGHVMLVPGGHRIPSVIKHVRHHRPVSIAALVL